MVNYITLHYNVMYTNNNNNTNNTNTSNHDRMLVSDNGVISNGAAAKVNNSDRLGKQVGPGTFGKIHKGGLEYPNRPSVNTHDIIATICGDPISADPICPFPNSTRSISI